VLGVRIPPGLPNLLGVFPALRRREKVRQKTGEFMELNIRSQFEIAKQFLREVRTELKKVTWPSRKDTLSGTAVVLVAVFVIAIFLGIVDSGLSGLIKMVLRKATG
jgi:preprotein translocase SecE subunit